MQKTLILLLLGAFLVQLSAMDDSSDRPSKKQKTTVLQNSDAEDKEKLDVLTEQKKEFEDYYEQNYLQYEDANKNLVDENGLPFESKVRSSRFGWHATSKIELQLQFAVHSNYKELAKDALDKGANPNMMLYEEECILLSFAISQNYTEILSLLLNHPEIDVNAYEKENPHLSPIFAAVATHSPEIIDLLIKSGAHVTHILSSRCTTLIYLFNVFDFDYPAEKYKEYDNYIKCAQILTKNGVKINGQDILDRTALMVAAFHNFPLKVIKFLVNELNAKINVKNDAGKTALDIAKDAYKNEIYIHDFDEKIKQAKEIIDFLECAMQKEKAFAQKLIKNEILEATPLPKELANLTSEYLETDGSINIV